MKRNAKIILAIFISAAAFLSGNALSAQTVPEGYEKIDSVIYVPVTAVDTTLAGKNIYDVLESDRETEVKINQSQLVNSSMNAHISSNSDRALGGYRVRIFFDNKQSARNESEATLKKFKGLFPDVKAYRIYANPYFKVTVGDFRTKSEAMALLARIKGAFPSAFVVKENIEYPVVDSRNAVIIDTIQVLRPKVQTVKK